MFTTFFYNRAEATNILITLINFFICQKPRTEQSLLSDERNAFYLFDLVVTIAGEDFYGQN